MLAPAGCEIALSSSTASDCNAMSAGLGTLVFGEPGGPVAVGWRDADEGGAEDDGGCSSSSLSSGVTPATYVFI